MTEWSVPSEGRRFSCFTVKFHREETFPCNSLSEQKKDGAASQSPPGHGLERGGHQYRNTCARWSAERVLEITIQGELERVTKRAVLKRPGQAEGAAPESLLAIGS